MVKSRKCYLFYIIIVKRVVCFINGLIWSSVYKKKTIYRSRLFQLVMTNKKIISSFIPKNYYKLIVVE